MAHRGQQRQRRKRHGQANYRLIRYADDFVVLVTGQREHAEALRDEVATVLAPMGLRLSPEKTRVVHIDDGLRLPRLPHPHGCGNEGARSGSSTPVPRRRRSPRSRTRVRTMTYRATLHHDPGYLMDYLGRVLRGWANYFRHGVSKASSTRSTPTRGSGSRPGCGRSTASAWPELRRRFCLPGTWRLAHDGRRFRGAASVTVIRYRYRGYRIPTPWTHRSHHQPERCSSHRGEPGAVKVARRVRRAARGNGAEQSVPPRPGRPNWRQPSRRSSTAVGPKELTGMVDLTRDQHGHVHARLLDLVPGPLRGTPTGTGSPSEARTSGPGVKIATLDPFHGYKNAIDDQLEDAIAVLDAFHVVKLASARRRRRPPPGAAGHHRPPRPPRRPAVPDPEHPPRRPGAPHRKAASPACTRRSPPAKQHVEVEVA